MSMSLRTAAEASHGRVVEPWGSLCWLASADLGNAQGVTVGRVTIEAGKSNPRHSHTSCEEVLYLLRGTLEHTVGEQVVTLEAGDTLVVGAGVAHNATNVGEEQADMMVVYSSGRRDFVPEP